MPIYRAPGRVTVIGDHTDHADGLALAIAIDRGITLEVTPGGDRHRLSSRGSENLDLPLDASPHAGWGRYVAAVTAEVRDAGVQVTGLSGHVASDLPIGAGLSSSGALEVAIALALLDAAGRSLPDETLIRLCRDAEERAVGVPCGLLDQATIVWGRRDRAILLSFADLGHELVEWPTDLALVVVNSGIARRLEDTAYAKRKGELLAGLAGSGDPAARRRVRHLRSENDRVRRVADLLRQPDPDRQAIGDVLLAGHASLRDDFEVSTPGLDRLVDLAVEHGAYGARLTGAGFGGAIVALADADIADEVAARVVDSYEGNAHAWTVRPDDGARRIDGGTDP